MLFLTLDSRELITSHVLVPSQVIVARSLTAKGVMSIATKVAVQLCCKIGGAPWSVEIPLSVSEQ
jgi:hypothetical protein